VVSSTPRLHFTPGKDLVPILQETRWAPGLVWTSGKSRRHWDSIPYRPAHSQSLYRLSYRAHIKINSSSSESVEQFKYLGTTLTNQNSIQEEIKSRLKSGNACYHLVQNLLSFCLLSKNINITIYRTPCL